ncbi:hypothetical protein U6B65_13455 [Oscillospiraceae bacterium MB08-C2-2]|nr:hypothetical protein U6B65_13455 [Oscillospiraceae bacterium MB08-C2-2]
MTFSKFAQILYPYLGTNKKPSEFVVFLTAQIMKDSFVDADFPLANKQDDTLRRIFNGTKDLSRKDAIWILSHLDSENFKGFLSELPNHVLKRIGDDIWENKKIDTYTENDIIDECNDLFVLILKELATYASKANSINAKSHSELVSEAMLGIFNQAIRDYSVADFINNELFKVYRPFVLNTCMDQPPMIDDFVMDDNALKRLKESSNDSPNTGETPSTIKMVSLSIVRQFIEYVETKIIVPFVLDQEGSIYQQIQQFGQLLENYHEYICKHIVLSGDIIKLRNSTIELMMEFYSQSMDYRFKISSLHEKICGISLVPPLPKAEEDADISEQEAFDALISQFGAYFHL